MKNTFLLVFIFCTQLIWGQKPIEKTTEFKVTGEVKSEKVISLADIKTHKSVKIKDVVITNHLGEKKGKASKLKGVLLKDLLTGVEFKSESPKTLSELYFTFVASDGYKVVFSWNEIFNSATGNSVYIITEKDGKAIADIENSILLMTTSDFQTGRRYVKGLSKIVVRRTE